MSKIKELRNEYHRQLCQDVIRLRIEKKGEVANFADVSSHASIKIASCLVEKMGFPKIFDSLKEQTYGNRFEDITKIFIESAFELLKHLRPGQWKYVTSTTISKFDQYEHLASLSDLVQQNKALSTALGLDYFVKPDIIVYRLPIEDTELNTNEKLVSEEKDVAKLTPLRKNNSGDILGILHASISCKWTIRSDRSQNTRTEALNLIRNRKGNLPHIVAVTAEPLPTRIASLALGTGDLDCVYHFALHELEESIRSINNPDQQEMLEVMIEGKRLRDISDLPFDLAI